MKAFIGLILFSFLQVQIFSQINVVSGTIFSENNEIIPNATIEVKNSIICTIADKNGNFIIGIPDQYDTLIFSCAGYESLEMPVDSNFNISVTLKNEIIKFPKIYHHFEIGGFGYLWPFKSETPLQDSYHNSCGGIEFGGGVSLLKNKAVDIGLTLRFSFTQGENYASSANFNEPKATDLNNHDFFIGSKIAFSPLNFIRIENNPKSVNPYLLFEFGSEVSYYDKVITTDYPKKTIDTTYKVRSPSLNYGFGAGLKISLSKKTSVTKVSFNLSSMYIFSSLTKYPLMEPKLGKFIIKEGRKENIYIYGGLVISNFIN